MTLQKPIVPKLLSKKWPQTREAVEELGNVVLQVKLCEGAGTWDVVKELAGYCSLFQSETFLLLQLGNLKRLFDNFINGITED